MHLSYRTDSAGSTSLFDKCPFDASPPFRHSLSTAPFAPDMATVLNDMNGHSMMATHQVDLPLSGKSGLADRLAP